MKIDIIYATAGEGHRKIALAIQESLMRVGRDDLEIRFLDALDFVSPAMKATYAPFYHWAVRRAPALWGGSYEVLDRPLVYSLARPFRSLTNSLNAKPLLKNLLDHQPDVVISTHFMPPEILGRAKVRGRLRAKILTVITDFFPHTVWTNPGTDHYWVMTEVTKHELFRRGVPPEKITAGGIPVSAAFKPSGNRLEVLKQYGLEQGRFTVLLTSGSFGLGPTEEILDRLNDFKERVQCFVVCARNESLKKKLEEKIYYFPVKIFGFVDCMPDLMEASDLMIAKSGGSTTSEALAKNLCMVVMSPIPGQETRNAKLLRDSDASFFLQKPSQISGIMQGILSDPSLMVRKQRAIAGLSRPDAADNLVRMVMDGKL